MKQYRWLIGVGVSALIIILGFVIKIEVDSPADETVIIDYTLTQYSAPACFDDAGFTNNIDEATYGEMEDSAFTPESECTTDALQSESVPLWFWYFR